MYGVANKEVLILNQPLASQPQHRTPSPNFIPNQIHPMETVSGAEPLPPSLHLTTLDSVFIKQEVELLEAITGFGTKKRYKLSSPRGELIFNAKEESDWHFRSRSNRPFEIRISDLYEQTVIHVHRPFRGGSICCPCCGLQVMEVYCPPGNLVGSLEQIWSVFPKFNVKDAAGNVIFTITGPFCTCSCACFCKNVDFKVLSADGVTVVGKISKKWSGALREVFTIADSFGIEFLTDLSLNTKATLIGACFLMDFMYFETDN